MANAFAKRQSENGRWEIRDIDDEQVIVVDGMPLSDLDEDEADDALRQLRSGETSPDNPKTPLAGEGMSGRVDQG